jgi:hypothetical protein
MSGAAVRTIRLAPRALTPALAKDLEARGLLTWIRHSPLAERRGMTRDWIKGPDFPAGIHGFHSVSISYTEIYLASHPKGQDEIVFLWNSEKLAGALYFVFALEQREAYVKKLAAGAVGPKDYCVVRAPMNDPRFAGFRVHAGTVHCEVTDTRGPKVISPSFFVLEPRKLVVSRTDEPRFGIRLELAAGRRKE